MSFDFGVAVAQRLELMSKEPTANSCVKCSLSGIGCSGVLRGAIDDLAVRMQFVAVRGTHLANHILAQEVRASVTTDPLPTLSDFLEPRWWQQCFKAAANPQSGKENDLLCRAPHPPSPPPART